MRATMTGAEWDRCTDSQAMLSFLRDSGKTSERKLRLFAAACCRQVWESLAPVARPALEDAEYETDHPVPPGGARRGRRNTLHADGDSEALIGAVRDAAPEVAA